jgi:phage N-6-adenine-methyltransferase
VSTWTASENRRADWCTPQTLFDRLDYEFQFGIDIAASESNTKCQSYYDESDDAFKFPWEGVCWCNPPYGRGIERWVEKAYHDSQELGSTIVMLLPAATDTNWWHDYCMKAEVRFIRGRVPFVRSDGERSRAPFASAVVVFRP